MDVIVRVGEITLINILTISVSIIAITISIYSIYRNNQNQKRQLKIGKIEEVLEIHHYLNESYVGLYLCYLSLESMNDEILRQDDGTFYNNEKTFENQKRILLNHIESYETLVKKLKRLDVLASCYITNDKLARKVESYGEMLIKLSSVVFGLVHFENSKVDLLPDLNKFQDFMYKVELGLVREMELKKTLLTREKFKRYKEKEFKKEFD